MSGTTKGDEPFTKVPNSVLEALFAARLSAGEFKVALYLIRRQLGFHSDRVHDSQTTIARKTTLRRQKIWWILKRLEDLKIVVAHRGCKRRLSYEFQRDPRKWEIARERKLSPPRAVVAQNGYELVAQNDYNRPPNLYPPRGQPSYKEKDSLKKKEKESRAPPSSLSLNSSSRKRSTEENRAINELAKQLLDVGIDLSTLKGKSVEDLRQIYNVTKAFPGSRVIQ